MGPEPSRHRAVTNASVSSTTCPHGFFVVHVRWHPRLGHKSYLFRSVNTSLCWDTWMTRHTRMTLSYRLGGEEKVARSESRVEVTVVRHFQGSCERRGQEERWRGAFESVNGSQLNFIERGTPTTCPRAITQSHRIIARKRCERLNDGFSTPEPGNLRAEIHCIS